MILQAAMLNVKNMTTSQFKLRDNVFAAMHILQPRSIKRDPMGNVVVRKVLVKHGGTLFTRHVVIKPNLMYA